MARQEENFNSYRAEAEKRHEETSARLQRIEDKVIIIHDHVLGLKVNDVEVKQQLEEDLNSNYDCYKEDCQEMTEVEAKVHQRVATDSDKELFRTGVRARKSVGKDIRAISSVSHSVLCQSSKSSYQVLRSLGLEIGKKTLHPNLVQVRNLLVSSFASGKLELPA